MYGQPRKLPAPPSAVTAITSISKHPSSPLFGYNMQLALLFVVLLFSFVSAYFGLFKTAALGNGKEKFANLSIVNGIF
jgi:hypothetical protein